MDTRHTLLTYTLLTAKTLLTLSNVNDVNSVKEKPKKKKAPKLVVTTLLTSIVCSSRPLRGPDIARTVPSVTVMITIIAIIINVAYATL